MERIFTDGDRFASGEPVGAGDIAGFDVAAEFAFEAVELTESGGGGLARIVAGVVGDDDGEGDALLLEWVCPCYLGDGDGEGEALLLRWVCP